MAAGAYSRSLIIIRKIRAVIWKNDCDSTVFRFSEMKCSTPMCVAKNSWGSDFKGRSKGLD
jgi:hypothetical protein